MICISVLVFCILICGSWSTGQLKFPPSFMFGAASSAYQVEGAWNISDKSPGLWDKLIHDRPELVADGSNGDVACDSYHLWRRDIEMCQELGLNMYRFSISWSRLLPSGFPNHISEDGKNYYNNLIDGLLEKGIQPLVTIFHFDMPQSLQDLGGWANPLISEWFADYAEVVFSLYADRVKYWLTINEPVMLCDGGYEEFGAPYLDDPFVGRYLCNKNALIAHAKAYRVYDELYRDKYHGKLSLSTLFFWFKPFTPEDQEVTDLSIDHWEGRYAHAIFSKEGGWPRKLEKLLNENARKEGYKHPRLPPFTPEEIELVRGTYDFYALNHYTTRLVRRTKPGEQPGKWLFYGSEELNTIMDKDPSWDTTAVDWFAIYPQGLREQLNWLNSTYDVKEIVITENGVPTLDPGLVDTQRLEYYRDYLEQVLLAIKDGINVTGYTAWTLMDGFEWLNGYVTKPGEQPGKWLFYGSEELNTIMDKDPSWDTTAVDWFAIYPQGLREQLNWLNSTYDVKEIVITENGVPTLDPGLVDTQRLEYYRDYLEQVLLAIKDGINVTGYTAWTLMDGFEWLNGYVSKFGLYAVDFSDPNRTRTPRESARYYSTVTRSRMIHPTQDDTKLNYV